MSEENLLYKQRHTLAHILAQAVQRVQQADVEVGIGPAIDNGAYYDFLFAEGKELKEEDLKNIEKTMQQIVKESQEIVKFEATDKDSHDLVVNVMGQQYKDEMRSEFISEGEKISFYCNVIRQAAKDNLLKNVDPAYIAYYEKVTEYLQKKYPDVFEGKFIVFLDMCEGPHVENTKEIDPKSFKVAKLAGAYRRGDENNIMMTRVYLYAFEDKTKMKQYMEFLEEAKKRDHRVLGKKLDLFCFSSLVGPGLPLFTPRGTLMIDLLQEKIEKICSEYGFEKVLTPHLAKIDLFKLSGHADKYPEELFRVTSDNKQDYVMKPVQCPHQTQIYASRSRSYRELPIRYMESNKQYRAELPGEISGLSRVVAITVEDGHSFCRVDQIKDEVVGMVNIIKKYFSDLGLWGNHRVSLSLRDWSQDKYIGEDADRKQAEKMLEEISEEMGLNAVKCEGEAAVYGPKLDFMFKDSLDREIQIPTVQVDFATPKRFDLKYTDENGEDVSPVMIHRAILGSYERLLVLLIEHFAGAFPFWLAPEQVRIIPVAEKFADYGTKILSQLKKEGIRVHLDDGNDSFSKKIRNGEMQKVPYLLIVGEQEEKNATINVRDRDSKKQEEISVEEFLSQTKNTK